MAMLRLVARRLPSAFLRRAATAANPVVAPYVAEQPRSLALPPTSKLRYVEPPRTGFKGTMLRFMGFFSNESNCIRGGSNLFNRLKSLVEMPELYSTFGMEKKFRTWHSVFVLHVWMCLARLRAEPEGSRVGQTLYDIFNHELELRMKDEGLKLAALRTRWLKELEKGFYGAAMAYDKAMQPTSDPDDLARALWRNVIAEDDTPMPTSGPALAQAKALASYVRKELACLSMTGSDDLMMGNILFTQQQQQQQLKDTAASE